ncbi:putative tetratricopeptide-like helical domain superfamily, DYW domain-containing protein [Helianthus annuus]|nr:pentatricopeptide repeat-containing protein At4g14850 [Helianthus annuus]XP_035834708.1 pentatricopeptide repeat-containing protein At4g14850 [Helianthus annuus]KAJ0523826.1 putative tetratricopeptide-like helical domain superfamily, DYW domain-containing protein [Helianthus annuus]KAJ0881461.1 putative tetratricopeptide-like helical domain superfamily, DYW domain-containing protein [Helianthus annuus]
MAMSSIVWLLETAISTRSSGVGRATHARMIKSMDLPFPTFLCNHLVNMYSKLDLLDSAQLIIPPQHRSVVAWTALIAGTVQNGHFSTAILQFSNMHHHSILPNDFTFPCVFKACNSLSSPLTGRQLHALAIKLAQIHDVFVGCSAFDMYSKTGLKEDACKLFDEMPHKNLATWNTYMSNAVLDGKPRKAVEAFIKLKTSGGDLSSITFCVLLNGCSDALYLHLGKQVHGFVIRYGYEQHVSVANGMIDFYGKCRDVSSARMVFDAICNHNDVSWCSMVAAYEQNDEGEKACMLFSQAMRNKVEPKDFIVSSVISACAGIAGLEMGRMVHALSVKACINGNVFVGSALVDMYAKCGSLEDCERMFDEMPERNLITWNALLGAYTHLGDADMALALFEEMKCGNVNPNYVTFVSILAACSRAGAVDAGLSIFESMRSRYGIEARVEHYACVVDMLGRAGMVEGAYEFIKRMPFHPTVSIWGSLLGACKVHRNNKLGKIAADHLFQLDPHDSGNHVILSNMFAAAGWWEEANVVRMEMKEVGISKGAGCSWISVKNSVHTFQAKDTCHERNTEIQTMLRKLKMEMKSAGYVADTSLALFDLEEEERESEVWHHSEKIALAFGLCVIPPGLPIRITKNMRICFDCHAAFKFISGITNREIIVRDNNRFHRFTKYDCSCRDYW